MRDQTFTADITRLISLEIIALFIGKANTTAQKASPLFLIMYLGSRTRRQLLYADDSAHLLLMARIGWGAARRNCSLSLGRGRVSARRRKKSNIEQEGQHLVIEESAANYSLLATHKNMIAKDFTIGFVVIELNMLFHSRVTFAPHSYNDVICPGENV